ncbi:hypothetical protein P8452_00247 [Trifolium repens]|nr:hypothetical protein P8452_00247 [Trifolium repens]
MLFIQKVYCITIFQLLITIAVVSFLLFVAPVANFFNNYVPDYVFGIVAIFAFFSVEYYHQKHPLNYLFLLIFTVSFALPIGLLCTLLNGKIILEAVKLTTAVVISLSLYTFWNAKRGHDFSFLSTFLDGGILVGIPLTLIKILYPWGKLSTMIYLCLAAIIFYCYIVYDTDNLIKKRFTYGKYISVSISLYLDVMLVFICLLTIFGVAELIKRKM